MTSIESLYLLCLKGSSFFHDDVYTRRPSFWRGASTSSIIKADHGRYDLCYSEVSILVPIQSAELINYIASTWICLAGSMGLVIPSGGSVAFLYGFIFCVLCNFAVVSSLGELAAIWPTAGGQYHFVYALCTDRWKNMMVVLQFERILTISDVDTLELPRWLDKHCGLVDSGHN